MRKVALRGLLARKTRLALTVVAVALGVTLIAGTYVFTDTINASFDKIFQVTNKGTDVAITPNTDISGDDGDAPAIPAATLAKVKSTPGVRIAEGAISDSNAVILGKDGKPITTGAPSLIFSVSTVPQFSATEYPQGKAPSTSGQVAIDKGTADRKHFSVGDSIDVQGVGGKRAYTISGVIKIAGVDSLGGASIAEFTLPEAQRVTGNVGKFDQISVAAQSGTTPAALRARLRAELPPTLDVRTGAQQADKQSKDIRDNLGFLNTALLAFAAIALFVGAFIIFNTFSITVAQRMREFALLRTLGASRAQVLRSVLGEGLLVGLVGSVVGLLLGIGLASGLRALFQAFGIDLPSNGTVIETRTIVVSLVVGTVVTLVSSTFPAVRATRVPPVAALREGAVLPETRAARFITPVSIVVVVLAVALLALGLFGSLSSNGALAAVGGGAALLFLGVALLSPRLVKPIASTVGWPIERIYGITGRLARENTVRLPSRTAVTAAALMIGVALVTFAAIFAASAKTTVHDAITSGSRADLVLRPSNFGTFPAQVGPAVAKVPGVQEVSMVRIGQGKVAAKKTQISGVDPATFPTLYHAGWKKGSDATLRALTAGETIVSKGYAEDNKVHVGDTLRVTTPKLTTVPLKVTGIIDDKGGLTQSLTVTNAVLTGRFGVTKDSFGLVGFAPGANAKQTKQAVDAVLTAQYPQVEAQTNAEYIKDTEDSVNQLLALIYALLLLSVIVSLFGIVNTLVLSISERTREIAMLRAIGTSRRQVRRIIRYEAVITALIGGILGAVLGLLLAFLMSKAIDDFSFALPYGQIVIVLILSGVAGVLAAVLPARRAAKLDVLDALAYE
jgi:putative ABC transport system permease protein